MTTNIYIYIFLDIVNVACLFPKDCFTNFYHPLILVTLSKLALTRNMVSCNRIPSYMFNELSGKPFLT